MKKSLIVKILTVVFAVSALSAGAVTLGSCMRRPTPPQITAGHTAMLPPPADGSLPTEHTGLENVSYLAYNLSRAQAYRSEAFSTVNTSVGFISYSQQVETYKDYKDGVMVVEDIAKSSLVNSAMQTCFVSDRALWRSPASSRAGDWQGRDTAWAEREPSNYSTQDYMEIYGLPCTEFSVYVLNEKTLKNWSEVTDNGDGTYSQTVYPDTEEAGQYYVTRMKTMGGLSDYPTFNSIEITYTFDSEWNVLSSVTEENYAIKMSVITSDNCRAVTEQTYSYNAEDVDISDYDSFFSRYVEKKSDGNIGEELPAEPTAVDYLSSAFAPVLAGAAQFNVEAALDGNTLNAAVYTDLSNLDNPEIRAEIAGMYIWYTDGKIYARIADNLCCFTTDSMGVILGSLGLNFDGDFTSVLNFEDILSRLSEGELTVSETAATLSSTLDIAGMPLSLTFSFNIDGKDISLRNVSLQDVRIGEHNLSASLSYASENSLPPLTPEQKNSAVDLTDYLPDILSLAMDGKLGVSGAVSLQTHGMDIVLHLTEANMDWSDGFMLYIRAQMEVADTLHDIQLSYRNNVLSVSYGKIGVQVKTNEFNSLSQAFLNVYERISSSYDAAAEQESNAAEEVVGLTAMSALFSSDTVNSLLNSLLNSLEIGTNIDGALQIALTVLSAKVNVTYDRENLNISAENLKINGGKLSFNLTAAEGSPVKDINGVEFITANGLERICDYILEVFELTQQTEWNIEYTASVNNTAEAYAQYGYVQYNVSGAVQIILADESEGKTFAASLGLAIVSTDSAERSYYIQFTVYEGWLYITVSYYNDAAEPNYNPLYLRGECSELSKLITTLKTVIGGDLSFLEGLLTPFTNIAELQPAPLQASVVVSDMFKELRVDGEEIKLTLDSNLLYKTEGLGDLSFALGHAQEENGLTLSLNNLYYNSAPQCWLDMRFTLLNAECNVAAPEGRFIDISTVDGLVDSVLNSFLSVSDGETSLLDGYYFNGVITCSIGGFNLNFTVTANILLKNGGIVLNATIAADSAFAVNSGRYITYITVDVSDDMVYMMREQYEYYRLLGWESYQTPVVTYRAMTLDQLGADYWNQIVYMTNMGDTVAGLIRNAINGSSGDGTGIDIRTDVGTYLTDYSYTDNVYSIALNGTNFADFLGDIRLNLTCNEEGKITEIVGSVNIYVTLSLSLRYENVTRPDGDYSLGMESLLKEWSREGYEITVESGHITNADSLTDIASFRSSVVLQNGENKSVIDVEYGAPMSELNELEDTAAARFMGWYTGENGTGERVTSQSIDFGFGGATLYAYWEKYVTVTLDAGAGTLEREVLYGIAPELWQSLSALTPERAGYIFTGWYTSDGEPVRQDNLNTLLANGGVTLYAGYEEIKNVALTLYSDIELDGYEYNEEAGMYVSSVVQTLGESLPAVEREGYTFLGWWYLAPEGDWRQVTPNTSLTPETVIKAMWISSSVNIQAGFTASGRTGSITVTDVSPAYVSAEIADKLTKSESFIYTFNSLLSSNRSESTSSRNGSHTFGLLSSARSGAVEAAVEYFLNGERIASASGVWNS